MDNNSSIQVKDSGGTYRNIFTFNTYNDFSLGYGPRKAGYNTQLQGYSIVLRVNDTEYGIDAMSISNTGCVHITQPTQGLRIGDGLLTWDSINNALCVSKADGSSANFYALGGVSALGIGTNADTNLTTLTVGTLSVTSALNSGTSTWLKMTQMCSNSGSSYWQIKTDGSAKFTDLEITGIGGKIQSYLVKANEITANKFYLDNTRYLYLSSDSTPKLMYYNGTTSKEVAFV